MRTTEVTQRQLTAEETAALDAKMGKPSGPRPKNEKEKDKAREPKQQAKAAESKPEPSAPETSAKPESPPKPPKPTPEELKVKLQETADAIAKATRLKDATATITSKSGREARILIPVADKETTLAFVSVTKKGLRIHVQDHGSERRQTVANVAEAAALVKQSERRKAKPAKAKKDEKSAKS